MFEIIFWVCVVISIPMIYSRIHEEFLRAKTLRRINDFDSHYWDYTHKCWITKINVPIEVQTVVNTQQCEIDK